MMQFSPSFTQHKYRFNQLNKSSESPRLLFNKQNQVLHGGFFWLIFSWYRRHMIATFKPWIHPLNGSVNGSIELANFLTQGLLGVLHFRKRKLKTKQSWKVNQTTIWYAMQNKKHHHHHLHLSVHHILSLHHNMVVAWASGSHVHLHLGLPFWSKQTHTQMDKYSSKIIKMLQWPQRAKTVNDNFFCKEDKIKI